jgi:hypothetical protein
MTTDVRIAFGAVSEIPVFPVTGSITKASDAPGAVVGVTGTAVVVVCAPTFPLIPRRDARQATLVSAAIRRALALARGRELATEVGVEVDTSDTAGHLYAFGEEVEQVILPIPAGGARYRR